MNEAQELNYIARILDSHQRVLCRIADALETLAEAETERQAARDRAVARAYVGDSCLPKPSDDSVDTIPGEMHGGSVAP